MELVIGLLGGFGLGVGVASAVGVPAMLRLLGRVSEVAVRTVEEISVAMRHPAQRGEVQQAVRMSEDLFRDLGEDLEGDTELVPDWMREDEDAGTDRAEA